MSTPDSTSASFSACDNIASFYEALNIPAKKSVDAFGGKSYTWYVTENGQPFKVKCTCTALSLGYGRFGLKSRVVPENSNPYFDVSQSFFKRSTPVNPSNGLVTLEGIMLTNHHTFRLPIPDKIKDQDI
jgi:hypothetical protein